MAIADIRTKLKTATDTGLLHWRLANPSDPEEEWEAWAILDTWTLKINAAGDITAQAVGGSFLPGGNDTDLLASVKTQIQAARTAAIVLLEQELNDLLGL